MIHKPTRREFIKYGVKAGILAVGVPTLLKFMETEARATGAFVQSALGTSNQQNAAIAYTSNVTAGSLLVAVAGFGDTQTLSTVTDSKSQSWTVIAATLANHASISYNTQIAYCMNAGAGATTVTLNFSAAVNSYHVIYEFSGAATTSALGQATSATGTSTTPSVSATTANANEIGVGVMMQSDGAAYYTITGTGWVNKHNDNSVAYRFQTGENPDLGAAGSKSYAYSAGGENWWEMSFATFLVGGVVPRSPVGPIVF